MVKIMNNIIKLTDSYKLSHFNQYPKGTETIHSYMSSRGGEYEELVFFGLTYYLKKYLSKSIDIKDVIEAEEYAIAHGLPFNREGWDKIFTEHNGYLPVVIKSLQEGSIFKPQEPILTIENTDPECAWLVGHLETLLMKIWYPITVATKSYRAKKMLKKYWDETSDNLDGVDFAFHNFGDRGSSSVESAAIGGLAHLTQFKGTDNFNSLSLAKEYYPDIFGFSIPATEHSTVTSWGRENEFNMIENYLEAYKGSPLIACVLDSYDIYKAVDFVTSGKMKEKIESDDYPIFVIRPDSGDPIEVIEKILVIMINNEVGFKINYKKHLVFDKYRIIWGDGVTLENIKEILEHFSGNFDIKISSENFAFGSGGDLMQNVNRDTCKFAIKCSAIRVNGEWRDVYKDPITDPGKKSLRGIQENSRFKTVFLNGKVL
jgi:nicotinamide phosphoribosyltransferase